MKTDATKQIRDAVASYTGAVTHCPPGKPRAPKLPKPKPPENKAVTWLQEQPGGGWPKETRWARRQRFKAQRRRIAAHNAAVRKAHGLRKSEVGGL
jgi:hypothetical protein